MMSTLSDLTNHHVLFSFEKVSLQNRTTPGNREYEEECQRFARLHKVRPNFILEVLTRIAITIDNHADYLFGFIDLKNSLSVSCRAWRKLKLFMLQSSRDKVRTVVMKSVYNAVANVASNGGRRQVTVNVMDAQPSRRRTLNQTLQSSIFGQLYKEMVRHGLLVEGKEKLTFLNSPMFSVHMPGFGAQDAGGPYRDVLQLLAVELAQEHIHSGEFNMNPLFETCIAATAAVNAATNRNNNNASVAAGASSATVAGVVANTVLIMPRSDALTLDPVARPMLEFFGMFLANFLVSGDVLAADFPPFLWKYLVEDTVTIHDLAVIDYPTFAKLNLEFFSGSSLSDLEEAFPGLTQRLKKRGILGQFPAEGIDLMEMLYYCYNENNNNEGDKDDDDDDQQQQQKSPTSKRQQIQKISTSITLLQRVLEIAIEQEVHRYDDVLDAIAKGLHKIVPAEALRALHWRDIQEQICGKATASVEDFKNAIISNLGSQRLAMFYRAIERLSPEERSLLLAFATGQRRFPIRQRLKVEELQGKSNTLPIASTCFFQLKLPHYSSEDIMLEKLRKAITECRSIDLDGGGAQNEVVVMDGR
jgi:hypothetical protein